MQLGLGLGLGTGNGYFIAFFPLVLKVTNTFVLPSWPGPCARASAGQWAWHRKYVTTVTSALQALWTKCIHFPIPVPCMTKDEEKVHVFLTKADIFTWLVNTNVPKPLKILCTQFDADTFQQC